jgi:four helix bundle protein
VKLQEVAGGYKKLLELGRKYSRKDTQAKSPAYSSLIFYKNICDIRRYVYKITKRFEKTHLRLVSQMRDAARSAKQNIRESYKKGSIGEFIHGINISRGSLEELRGDIEDCHEDGLLFKDEFEKLIDLIKSADYMSFKYLESLYKMEKENKWKVPGSRRKK